MNKVIYGIREKAYNLVKYIKYPEKAICSIGQYKNYKYAFLIPDKLYLKCLYKKHMQKRLNLKHPRDFNEKLQWLKLYDRKPEYRIMADKVEAKRYVANRIGDNHIIPTIGVFEDVNKIRINDLPDRFVIKCTHDSGSTYVCADKKIFDFDSIKNSIAIRMKSDFFWFGREWSYKNIKPRIIVEEFIGNEDGICPVDYKFFCFNGKMEFFKIDYNRFTKRAANYYNRELELQPFGKINSIPDPSIPLELPDTYNEMVAIAERLSQGIPFLRVDLYSVEDVVYFGELTFYPSSGIERFVGEGDVILGDRLVLPHKRTRCRK